MLDKELQTLKISVETLAQKEPKIFAKVKH